MPTSAETLERIATASSISKEELRFHHQEDFLLRRLVVVGILNTAREFPGILPYAYNHVVLQPSHHWVGVGYEHVVVSDGETVLKIDRGSRRMSPDAQETRAEWRRQRYEQGLEVMKGYMLRQSVRVRPLPTRQPAVACVTEQQLVGVVADVADQQTDRVLRQLHDQGIPAATIGDNLEHFCEISEKAFSNGGLTPDIVGPGNIVVARDSNLILLDSYLIDAEEREKPVVSEEFVTAGDRHREMLDKLWQRVDELKAA